MIGEYLTVCTIRSAPIEQDEIVVASFIWETLSSASKWLAVIQDEL